MRYQPADIFFIAGEASGDLQASLLSRALQAVRPGTHVAGVGGDALAASGAQLAYHSPEIASIGPLSVIPMLPRLYAVYLWLDRSLRRQPPALLTPVDAGGFNIPLLRRLRRRGYRGKALYYFPPGAWVDNARQARAVADLTMPLTAFAHQRDFYRSLDLRIEYFGHPLVSVISPRTQPPPAVRPHIAVLPGSRHEEVVRHVPVLARAAALLEARCGARFTLVASSAARARQIRSLWPRRGGPGSADVVRTNTIDALRTVTLAWVASGTAVLEAALSAVPQVAFYTVSHAQYRIAQRKLPAQLMRTITLPNLVMQRMILPELLQHDFTAQNLTEQTLGLLGDDQRMNAQLAACADLRNSLGPPDALQHIARFVAHYMNGDDRP